MPVKRIKDLSKCIAQFKLKCSESPFYWHVYLWQDQQSLIENTGEDVQPKIVPGNNCQAAHCPVPTLVDPETDQLVPGPKLGEIHFIQGVWTLEIVAHELLHAMFHRIRTLKSPCVDRLFLEMEVEELVCYEFGA